MKTLIYLLFFVVSLPTLLSALANFLYCLPYLPILLVIFVPIVFLLLYVVGRVIDVFLELMRFLLS